MNKRRAPAHRRGPAVRPPGRTSPRALSGHEVRNLNRHLLLSLIRARQPISRADLARQTGLQRSTVSLITGTLIRQRWVTEGATGQSRQGRKPTLLYLNVDRARILGIDIRPALTTMAIADPNGRVIAQELFPTAQHPEVFVQDLCRRLRAFVKAHPEIAFEGLGITVPGRIDQQRQRLVLAPNLGWRNVDLKTPIENALGIPVEMENAANACALAEASFGVHGGVRDLIAVTVSEGIGTGIISDGRLLRGAAGMAGEFGHVCLDERGPLCKCGQRGCWEVFASNAAAVADYLRATGDHSRLAGARPGPRPSFEDLLVLAQQGDRRAVEALERMARYLGDGIAMLATGLAPSRILVVGEITRAWDLVGPIVLERAAAKSSGALPHILPAGDGGLARLRGTVALVLQKHFGVALVA